MADPLAQFRRTPAASTEVTNVSQEPGEYVAFGVKDHIHRLRIRRANAPTHAPDYDRLQDISYDGEFGTNFVLFYTFMIVLVRGRNLQPVIAALEKSTADFIQEFDPDTWTEPKDAAVPFIESIQVEVAEGGQPAENLTPPPATP
jgi:hypothetical protein